MGTKPPATLEPHTPEARPSDPAPGKSPYAELDLDQPTTTKNYWWVWLIVFALIGYGCYKLYQYENVNKAAMAKKKGAMRQRNNIPVVAAAAHSGDMPVYLQGLGTVTAFNTVTVKTRADGQLINVNFREGQLVRDGDLLATIDPRQYEVALAQANGNLAQAKGTLAKDQAALKDAQANYVRDQELYKEQIIAKQQLDTQLAAADQIKGSIQADQAAIDAAQAMIDTAKLNLTYTRITAPISGRIGLRMVDAGNMVHASDATGLAVITQLQPIAVLFNIPEDQLQSVLQKLSQGTKLRTEAYDRDQSKKLAEGTLLTVDNQIDTTTGTSKLKAVFPNTDGALFPNQFVNVRLWLDTRRNVTIIPAVAIQRGPTGTFVYLVQDDSTVSVHPVKVGLSEGNDVSIDEGLKSGDNVVVDGAEKLTDGMRVMTHAPVQAASGAADARQHNNSGRRGKRSRPE
jgi:multidrug efflux system membrane fusion protein